MSDAALANLAKISKLKAEPAARAEFEGLLRSGQRRLHDAENTTLNLESRFDLAYNAAHALALAALSLARIPVRKPLSGISVLDPYHRAAQRAVART